MKVHGRFKALEPFSEVGTALQNDHELLLIGIATGKKRQTGGKSENCQSTYASCSVLLLLLGWVVITVMNVTGSTRSEAQMESGTRDSSTLLLYHQPHVVFLQLLPLRRLNSVAAESKHKAGWPTMVYTLLALTLCLGMEASQSRPADLSLTDRFCLLAVPPGSCPLGSGPLCLGSSSLALPGSHYETQTQTLAQDCRKTSEIMESLTWVFF